MTLVVQFAGGCFWRTLCFVIHQYRSTLNACDGLFHQQQIILRNAVTAPNALFSLLNSALAWRNRASSSVLRSLPLLVITGVHIGCFAAAGLLSSQIASTKSGQALVSNQLCGYPQKLPAIQADNQISSLTEATVPIFTTQVSLVRQPLTRGSKGLN